MLDHIPGRDIVINFNMNVIVPRPGFPGSMMSYQLQSCYVVNGVMTIDIYEGCKKQVTVHQNPQKTLLIANEGSENIFGVVQLNM